MWHTSAICPSEAMTVTAVISFFVNVPVLSEHITVTHPRVSTAGNFLTTACLEAIRITPIAKVTATTIGKPSGIAATAKLKEIIIGRKIFHIKNLILIKI